MYNNFAHTQNDLPEGAEEGIFGLKYDIFQRDIMVIIHKDSVYLPLFETLLFLKIFYNFKDNNNIIYGYVQNEKAEYEINLLKESFYNIENSDYSFNKRQYIKTETEIYFTADIISKLFLCKVYIFANQLLIKIESKSDLPVLVEEKRYNKYANMSSGDQFGADKILPVIYDRNFKVIDGGIFVYNLSGMQNKINQRLAYSTNSGIELLGGEFQQNASGGYDFSSRLSSFNQNFRWRYSFNENKYISFVFLGDLTNRSSRASSFSSSTASSGILRGVQISNENSVMPTVFNIFTIEGKTEPGWQVELYSNAQLYAVVQSDNIGYYSFKLPVKYGNTNVELKFYGPKGEFMTKIQPISVPAEFLASGTVKYNINLGKYIDTKKYGSNANFSLGLTDWLTNSTQVDNIEKFKDLNIVNSTTLRIYGGIIINSVYAPKNFINGGIKFSFAEYGNYDLNYSKSLINLDSINPNIMGENLNNIGLNIGLPRLFSLPFSLTFRGQRYFNNTMIRETLGAFLGIFIDKFSLNVNYNRNYNENKTNNQKFITQDINPTLNFSWYDKPKFLSFMQNTTFSVSTNYSVNRKVFPNINFSIQQQILKDANLSINYTKNFEAKTSSISLSFNMNLPYFRVGSTITGNTYTENLSGMIGLNPSDLKLYFSSEGSNGSGNGAAVVRFFIDKNNNSIYDKGEEEIPEVQFFVPNATIEDDKKGDKKVYNLIPAARYNLFVKKGSIRNPFVLPKYEEFSFIADPYSFKVIDVPCYMTGSVEGQAYKAEGDKKAGQGGIRVHLINLEKNADQVINLFSDGSFYKIGIVPGKYKVYIDSVQLRLLNCTSNPEFINFEVKSNEEGDVISGLDFDLVPKPVLKKEMRLGIDESEIKKENINFKQNDQIKKDTIQSTPVNKPITDTRKNEIEKVITTEIFGQAMLLDRDIENKNNLIRKSGLNNIRLRITDGKDAFTTNTDSSGKFRFKNFPTGKWTLGIIKDDLPKDYKSEKISYTLDIKAGMKQEQDIKVIPSVKVNSVVPGELKTFSIKDTLSESFIEYLNQVAEMSQYSKLSIVINSYSDSIGTVNESNRRSRNDAKKVKDYLISKKVDSRVIQTYSFGARQPIAPNDSPENREKNRRIEIMVMKFNN